MTEKSTGEELGQTANSIKQEAVKYKHTQSYLQLALEILGILNRSPSLDDTVNRILEAIKRELGFDAVGVRLREGNDFPYLAADGFSLDFLITENNLTVKLPDGGVCLDENGDYALECTCGVVLAGKTDSTKPFFTPAGSFWSNDTFPLLELSAESDPRLHPRNLCIHEGFQSVALIPIRANKEIVGLLQLNDRPKNAFTLDMIEFFEGICDSFGVALIRRQNEANNQKLQKQLQQSQKMEAISKFAGGIAHEFNNILGVITGNISYALSTFSKEHELYEVLFDVQEASKKARNLIQHVITFSKGGAPIKKPADINKLLNDAVTFAIRGMKTEYHFDLSNDLWAVEIDEGQMNIVIANLVINADQAMPDGGLITVRTENTAVNTNSGLPLSTGRYVKIEIEDQGIGISKENIPHIFDPYFTTKQEGRGLGLATSYSIVSRHGGTITVCSEIEKGTVLNIYLPAALKNDKKTIVQKESVHTGQGLVLIMDDQESILKMAGRMLNRMGYDTVFATDGTQAVKLFSDAYQSVNPFNLVILDLTIPGGMGGAQVIPELLKIDPYVKVVVSSGYSNDPVMANYEKYGFCGVIPKPYTKDQMADLLNIIFCEKK